MMMNILGVECTPLYRLLTRLEEEKEVIGKKLPESSHAKVFILESEWKAKMESEKTLLSNCNHMINNDDTAPLSKTQKSGKRDEKMESGGDWEPEDETIDPWDNERPDFQCSGDLLVAKKTECGTYNFIQTSIKARG